MNTLSVLLIRLHYGSTEHNSELLIALFQTLADLNFIRRIYQVLHRIVRNLKHQAQQMGIKQKLQAARKVALYQFGHVEFFSFLLDTLLLNSAINNILSLSASLCHSSGLKFLDENGKSAEPRTDAGVLVFRDQIEFNLASCQDSHSGGFH